MQREEAIQNFWSLPDPAYAGLLVKGDPEVYDFAKVFIHTHTDLGSPKDSVLTVKQYVETAKHMGAKAIAVTDHGTMYAVPSLYELCKKAGIKLLIGCEFYVCDDLEDTTKKKHTRLHLCGYAKDDIGYHTIARLITESNTRMDGTFPCVSKQILQEFMGPGTEGHGHVALTSACIGGVLTGISYANENEKVNLGLLDQKIADCERILSIRERILLTKDELEEKVAAYEESVKTLKGEDKEAAKRQLKELKKLKRQVGPELTKLQKEIDAITKIPHSDPEHFQAAYERLKNERKMVSLGIIPEDEITGAFLREAKWYDALAGHGNFFLELQYHGIAAEQKYMHVIAGLAETLDIPTIAANDAHMQKKEDLDLRKVINGLRFNQYEEAQEGDPELYLKSDPALFQSLMKAVSREQAWKAMKGRQILADMCDVELKKEPHYPKYVA